MEINNYVIVLLIVSASVFSGCGTMVQGFDYVYVESTPPNADVKYDGKVLTTTPDNISIDPTSKKTHEIYVVKDGFKSEKIELETKVSAGFVFFDVIFGVFPLLIDASTGDWRVLKRSNVSVKLEPIAKRDKTIAKTEGEEERDKPSSGINPVFKSNNDQSNNKNKNKEASNIKSARYSDVGSEIPETSSQRPNDIAVVIGNKNYDNSDIPNVDYALRDAQIVSKYLNKTFGLREENIIYVENASGAAMERIFGTSNSPKGQLYNWVKSKRSNVFVYYSGHGAPNPQTGNAYLIPSNSNPNYLSQNGYPLNQLYENLSQIPAKSITVILEACFSGTSEGGAVVPDASAVLSVENPMVGMKNGLAFTAGATDQIASWYPEKKHGLFTYYFLKGLRGNADMNEDKAVTAKEMESYLTDKIPYRARRMYNREQTPQVIGRNKNQVLVKYEGEVPEK